jgi:hypothetical protein
MAEKHRATRIVWDYSIPNPSDPSEKIIFRSIRRASTYLELGRYLLLNPPNKHPFRPGDLGKLAYAVQTYRRDVETWVAMRMCKEIMLDPDKSDGELLKKVIDELHNLSWDSDCEEKGFFLIQPMMDTYVAVSDTDWSLEAVGVSKIPSIKAKCPKTQDGKKLKGYWYEPSFEQYEAWNSRIAIIHLRRMTEMFAECALTGQQIGGLTIPEMFSMVRLAVGTVKHALQMPSESKSDKKALPESEKKDKHDERLV